MSCGLSPRTRGTVLQSIWSLTLFTVYPRERGEQSGPLNAVWIATGLSPRTRGTDANGVVISSLTRFIPANAGNRRISVQTASVSAVYPRERGEQWNSVSVSTVSAGLSPRTRGTVSPTPFVQVRHRFIPANAGNRRRRDPDTRLPPVYPRERGEQPSHHALMFALAGLSPRTRGTGLVVSLTKTWPRFIPANAGNRGPCEA